MTLSYKANIFITSPKQPTLLQDESQKYCTCDFAVLIPKNAFAKVIECLQV